MNNYRFLLSIAVFFFTFQINIQAQDHLYKQCLNVVKFNLENFSNFSYQVNNGKVFISDKDNELYIYPEKKEVVHLKVLNNNTIILEKEFEVLDTPAVEFHLIDNFGNKVIKTEPISRELEYLEIKAVANSSFGVDFPNEANYEIQKLSVVQYRGNGSVGVMEFEGNRIPLDAFELQEGDLFSIKIEKVGRITSLAEMAYHKQARGKYLALKFK